MSTLESRLDTAAEKLAGKYLTFVLGNECHGIPVLKVREIIRLASITAVPQMPPYIKGVINLRGKIIPVMDLCAKFGLETASADGGAACIAVVQVSGPASAPVPLGLMVDAVEEVANFVVADIEQTPDFGAAVDTAYILGMAKSKEGVKALLDIDRVVGHSLWAGLETERQPGGPQ
jgi:purine-binding chemotaxis protein CheW